MEVKKCKICGKEIKGWNKKMLEWNMRVHLEKHKRENIPDKKKLKRENE